MTQTLYFTAVMATVITSGLGELNPGSAQSGRENTKRNVEPWVMGIGNGSLHSGPDNILFARLKSLWATTGDEEKH